MEIMSIISVDSIAIFGEEDWGEDVESINRLISTNNVGMRLTSRL